MGWFKAGSEWRVARSEWGSALRGAPWSAPAETRHSLLATRHSLLARHKRLPLSASNRWIWSAVAVTEIGVPGLSKALPGRRAMTSGPSPPSGP